MIRQFRRRFAPSPVSWGATASAVVAALLAFALQTGTSSVPSALAQDQQSLTCAELPSCNIRGDFNCDGVVNSADIDVLINLLFSPPCNRSSLLQTGQTQCDQGGGTLGACLTGSPAGQDGAVQAGRPFGYTDNGDGTIEDVITGLTWEKLSDDGGVHDRDKTYTWYDAFRVKIAALNKAPCFAGHCDWRLPNRRELGSLVDADRVAPAVDPAFGNDGCTPGCAITVCSCTELDRYWSSTTYHDTPSFAWTVDGNTGIVTAFDKSIAFYVRAVRGGL